MDCDRVISIYPFIPITYSPLLEYHTYVSPINVHVMEPALPYDGTKMSFLYCCCACVLCSLCAAHFIQ